MANPPSLSEQFENDEATWDMLMSPSHPDQLMEISNTDLMWNENGTNLGCGADGLELADQDLYADANPFGTGSNEVAMMDPLLDFSCEQPLSLEGLDSYVDDFLDSTGWDPYIGLNDSFWSPGIDENTQLAIPGQGISSQRGVTVSTDHQPTYTSAQDIGQISERLNASTVDHENESLVPSKISFADTQVTSKTKVEAGQTVKFPKIKNVPDERLHAYALWDQKAPRSRRPKVGLKEMRNLRACIKCRLKKRKCDPGPTCQPCEDLERLNRSLQSSTLRPCGFHDCIRERLIDLSPVEIVHLKHARAAFGRIVSRLPVTLLLSAKSRRREERVPVDHLRQTGYANAVLKEYIGFSYPRFLSSNIWSSSAEYFPRFSATPHVKESRKSIESRYLDLVTVRNWYISKLFREIDQSMNVRALLRSDESAAMLPRRLFTVFEAFRILLITLHPDRKADTTGRKGDDQRDTNYEDESEVESGRRYDEVIEALEECICMPSGEDKYDRMITLFKYTGLHLSAKVFHSSGPFFERKSDFEEVVNSLGCCCYMPQNFRLQVKLAQDWNIADS